MTRSNEATAPLSDSSGVATGNTLLKEKTRVSTQEVGSLVGWAGLACILTLVNRFAGYPFQIAGHHFQIHLPAYATVGGHLLAIVYLSTLLLALLQTARAAVSLPLSTGFLLATGAVLSLPSLSVLFTTLAHVDIPMIALFYSVVPPVLQAVVNNFLGPIGLSFLGAAIGRVIKHPNTLLAGAGFAIFFDIVVVTMGTVAQLMKSGSNVIAAVSVGAGAPIVPSAGGGPRIQLPDPISGVTIGPADVLFLALFLSAVFNMQLSRRATFAWMFVLLSAALALVETIGLPIPALVPMGTAVLIANLRHGAFTPTEKRDLIIGGIFALFCAGLMIKGAQRFVGAPAAPPRIGFGYRPTPDGTLLIDRILPDSPADKAGLKTGDAIQSINGLQINTMTGQTFEEQRERAVKDGMRVRIRRPQTTKPIDLTIPPLL